MRIHKHVRQPLLILSVLLALIVLPARTVHADMGPKPTMEFVFDFGDESALTISGGELLQCEDSSCELAEPLEQLGPQGFTCVDTSCSAMAYGFSDWSYLRITFSDGSVRESNIFGKEHFDAEYTVTVLPDSLEVEGTGGRANPMLLILGAAISGSICVGIAAMYLGGFYILLAWREGKKPMPFEEHKLQFIAAWVLAGLLAIGGGIFSLTVPLTAALELVAAWLYLRWRDKPRVTMLTLVLIVNVLTQFILLGVFSNYFGDNYWSALLLMELLIWQVEAALLYLPRRKHFTFFEVVGMSLTMNAVSFLVGLLLPF